MNIERRARDYDQRLEAAGGADPVIASLAAAVNRSRRVQYMTVVGLIVMLGIVAVLVVTIIDVNQTTNSAERNRLRGVETAQQTNDIVRCLTKTQNPGKCLGLTVPPGSPGSRGLRGTVGTPGLPGPRGAQGRDGQRGSKGVGTMGRAGNPGPMGDMGDKGDKGDRGDNGSMGTQGSGTPGPQGAPGAPGPAGAPGAAPVGIQTACPDGNGGFVPGTATDPDGDGIYACP